MTIPIAMMSSIAVTMMKTMAALRPLMAVPDMVLACETKGAAYILPLLLLPPGQTAIPDTGITFAVAPHEA
jgi:hypothetical protein